MINLDEHIIYNNDLKIETVPLSIAKQAVAQALENGELNEVLEKLKSTVLDMNLSINQAIKDD